ncbi:MAG: hypothetical protein AB8H03_16325 [Saprospiraceae bacterium]
MEEDVDVKKQKPPVLSLPKQEVYIFFVGGERLTTTSLAEMIIVKNCQPLTGNQCYDYSPAFVNALSANSINSV